MNINLLTKEQLEELQKSISDRLNKLNTTYSTFYDVYMNNIVNKIFYVEVGDLDKSVIMDFIKTTIIEIKAKHV